MSSRQRLRRQRRRERQFPPPQENSEKGGQESILPPIQKLALALDVVAIGLSIVGILLWAPSYSSNIHVDHRGSVDARLPFTTLFSITNNGYFAVFDVRVSCRLNQVTSTNGLKVEGITVEKRPGMTIQELERSETFDVPCPFENVFKMSPNDSISSASIDVAVSFIPRLWHVRHLKCVEFDAAADAHGDLNWMQKPVPAENCAAPLPVFRILGH